jgi:hypothetical protein
MTVNHPSTPSRGRTPRVLVAAALVLALAAAFFVLRQDNPASQPPAPAPKPPPATAPPTTLDPEKEVVARLQEILRVRDEAYVKRDTELLESIYTTDCPCLEGDGNAIRELRKKRYMWVGASSSIRVRRVERVTNRQWLITADFQSAPLQIKSETGRLVRREAGGSELFQFALAKPPTSDEWLLGRATSYKNG